MKFSERAPAPGSVRTPSSWRSSPSGPIIYVGLAPIVVMIWSLLWPYWPSEEPGTKTYSIRVLSYDPLIIYIIGFLSLTERKFLASLSRDSERRFERSKVFQDGVHAIDSFRTSSTAFLATDNLIAERIIARASEVQGYTDRSKHEGLQLTRYETGQQFRPHLDPLEGHEGEAMHRLTTIFAIVEATCVECGTQFPNLRFNWTLEHPSWCNYVDCNEDKALTIKAVPGNAVFWKSWDTFGRIDNRTLHAGLPPEKGTKIGLNIWTNG
ncbi:hypothetical protein CSAL01_13545 [Colletotrichum salicis]|uniref:Prolyl 4-hydroxylase alpha subunit domain-containing protein n=1 Tax=Colletotrichum salicis TaxID=1209931 RepID=A0A135TRY6_9PEZI|nr:hypothetical protein CSAL01_13545 [Colletotrichum salicis]